VAKPYRLQRHDLHHFHRATTQKNYELAYPDEGAAFWETQARASWRERPDGQLEPAYDPAIGDAILEAVKKLKLVNFLRKLGLRRMKGLNLDPWDNFRAVTMPCLLLHGERSDILITDIIERMRAIKPDLEVLTVANRGHVPTLSEPEVVAALDRFFERY